MVLTRAHRLIGLGGKAARHNPYFDVGHWGKIGIVRGAHQGRLKELDDEFLDNGGNFIVTSGVDQWTGTAVGFEAGQANGKGTL
ncbi:hypothetical protein PROH_10190 [Prochlorothrix hollandica PCC 9006 = CALU 1027]|uniref:Uncharacterized protein n=1 Tax=Prochlorothrix hollandica PCC 9006 = CALU 1027 TaxID=317619 RepID=A0A0M2PUA1_PROHO|nr:hypothetical protein PROH_10190 [Prochlorothrix hollandica PCC 9006 = CALU 1027]